MAEGQHLMHKRTPNQTGKGAVSGLCSVEGATSGNHVERLCRKVHGGGWMEGGRRENGGGIEGKEGRKLVEDVKRSYI